MPKPKRDHRLFEDKLLPLIADAGFTGQVEIGSRWGLSDLNPECVGVVANAREIAALLSGTLKPSAVVEDLVHLEGLSIQGTAESLRGLARAAAAAATAATAATAAEGATDPDIADALAHLATFLSTGIARVPELDDTDVLILAPGASYRVD